MINLLKELECLTASYAFFRALKWAHYEIYLLFEQDINRTILNEDFQNRKIDIKSTWKKGKTKERIDLYLGEGNKLLEIQSFELVKNTLNTNI